jgi:signal transduction histidine kinase
MGNCIKKNILLVNQIDSNTLVYADTNMIQSVVQNLVSNAIKFTNAGGQITLSSQIKESLIEVAVSDTGVGMKEDDLEKIFRIDAHHTTLGTAQEKGTGLGLLLCKDLIEKHGGAIWVESTYGKGTTFRFTLPVYTEQDKTEL